MNRLCDLHKSRVTVLIHASLPLRDRRRLEPGGPRDLGGRPGPGSSEFEDDRRSVGGWRVLRCGSTSPMGASSMRVSSRRSAISLWVSSNSLFSLRRELGLSAAHLRVWTRARRPREMPWRMADLTARGQARGRNGAGSADMIQGSPDLELACFGTRRTALSSRVSGAVVPASTAQIDARDRTGSETPL